MKTQDELGAGRFFQAEALRADGHASIRADFEGGAHTPDIRPPRAAWDRTEGRPVFFFGLIPGPLRGLAQLPMDFVRIVMGPQPVDRRIGRGDFADFFAGEIGGQPPLPELVFAFDFAFGLGAGA